MASQHALDISDEPYIDLPDNYSDSYHSGGCSLEDDAALNEFITDPTFNQLPMLERRASYNRYFFQTGVSGIVDNLPVNIQDYTLHHYYMAEFVSCLAVSIAVNSSILMLNIIPACEDKSLSYYILTKAIMFLLAGYIAYIFTMPKTYRSINTSVEVLAINWTIHIYKGTSVLVYLAIQIAASLLGALITIGLFYNMIVFLDKEKLVLTIMSVPRIYLLTPSYTILSIVVQLVSAAGLAFIMDSTNSLNCQTIVIQRVAYIGIISLVYGPAMGQVGFMSMYRLGLYAVSTTVFNLGVDTAIVITVITHTGAKLLLYPFIAFHVKYVWKNAIQRYIEYK